MRWTSAALLCATTTAAAPAPIYGVFNGYGECVMDALINDKPMQFIVDTATDGLYLSRYQAWQLHIDPLKRDVDTDEEGNRISTFTVSVKIGDFFDPEVEAAVEIKDREVDPIMGRSLLQHFNFQMSAKSCELDPISDPSRP
jgi:predicted aspartyl protease